MNSKKNSSRKDTCISENIELLSAKKMKKKFINLTKINKKHLPVVALK